MTALWYLLRPNGMTVINSVVYFNISPALLIFSSVAAYFLLRLLCLYFPVHQSWLKVRITVSAGNNSITLEIVDTETRLRIYSAGRGNNCRRRVCKNPFRQIDPAPTGNTLRYRVMPCAR
ncbi:MAG: hypothetical protein ACLR56_07650 [Oscillospiraceae bacterium]